MLITERQRHSNYMLAMRRMMGGIAKAMMHERLNYWIERVRL